MKKSENFDFFIDKNQLQRYNFSFVFQNSHPAVAHPLYQFHRHPPKNKTRPPNGQPRLSTKYAKSGIYPILGIPSCLHISLHKVSFISLCLGTAVLFLDAMFM